MLAGCGQLAGCVQHYYGTQCHCSPAAPHDFTSLQAQPHLCPALAAGPRSTAPAAALQTPLASVPLDCAPRRPLRPARHVREEAIKVGGLCRVDATGRLLGCRLHSSRTAFWDLQSTQVLDMRRQGPQLQSNLKH